MYGQKELSLRKLLTSMQTTYHKFVNGDSREMGESQGKSVRLIVISPPYSFYHNQ